MTSDQTLERGKVTILMPTFEREGMIGEAIESARHQTFEDFVLLIGDNSENDRTEELVAAIDDPRIRYHRNRPGLGPMGNWCDLVKRAETEFIATLHDDDSWHPDYLQTAIPPMVADSEIAMVYNDFWMMDKDSKRLVELTDRESARTGRASRDRGSFTYDRDEGVRLVAVENAPQPAYAAVVRTDLTQAITFPTDIEPLYDVWLTYALTQAGHKLYYLNDRLTNYRVHAASDSSVSPQFAKAENAFFEHVINDNADLPETVTEVRQYWAWLRWARATKLMHDTSTRKRSQQEFSAAAKDLAHPAKRMAALGAAKLGPVWHGLRLARRVKQREPSHRVA